MTQHDNYWSEISVNVTIHVLILFTILSLLFWNVISQLEESAFNNEMQQMTTDGVTNALSSLDKSQNGQVKTYINNNLSTFKTLRDISNTENEMKKTNNEWLMTCNVMCVAFLFILLITMIVCLRNVPVKFLLKENLVVFCFIGLVEVAFFLVVAQHFIPIKPSSTTLGIYSRAKQNILGE